MDWVALDFPSIDATPGLRLIYSHLEKKFAVAKMESSLSASGALDPDRDLDHFRLRIKNLPDNTIASLKLRTQKSDGSTLDPATKISLTRTVGQQDFLTRSLLLVSDTNDDEESQATVGTDEADNDRTHLAELGSKIIVDSFDLTFPNSTATLTLPVTSLNAEVPIDPLRSFTIRVIRLSDCAIPMATIQTYITRLKERYAQVGITLNVPIPQEATVPVELTENNGQGSIIPSIGNQIHPSAKLLIERFGTLANNPNEIHVIYCKDTTSDGVRVKGFTRIKGEAKYLRNAFIGSVDPYIYTISHEIGHILTKANHYGPDTKPGNYEPYAKTYLVEYNLMRAGTLPYPVIKGSKRFNQRQENMIFKK